MSAQCFSVICLLGVRCICMESDLCWLCVTVLAVVWEVVCHKAFRKVIQYKTQTKFICGWAWWMGSWILGKQIVFRYIYFSCSLVRVRQQRLEWVQEKIVVWIKMGSQLLILRWSPKLSAVRAKRKIKWTAIYTREFYSVVLSLNRMSWIHLLSTLSSENVL